MSRFKNTLFVILAAFLFSPPALAGTQYTGKFEKNKNTKRVTGTWTLDQTKDGWVLNLGDDFKAKKAPDLKFFLSKKAADAVTGKNATVDSVLVQPISQYKGGFRVKLPEDVNPSDYQSLVLHCEQYSKLWGADPLGSPSGNEKE